MENGGKMLKNPKSSSIDLQRSFFKKEVTICAHYLSVFIFDSEFLMANVD